MMLWLRIGTDGIRGRHDGRGGTLQPRRPSRWYEYDEQRNFKDLHI